MDHDGIVSGAPSAIPMEMDMWKINRGWARQVARLGFDVIDDIGGVEKIQQMGNEEYEGVKQYVFGFLKEKAPEFYHIAMYINILQDILAIMGVTATILEKGSTVSGLGGGEQRTARTDTDRGPLILRKVLFAYAIRRLIHGDKYFFDNPVCKIMLVVLGGFF
jgi:hypothetical protein